MDSGADVSVLPAPSSSQKPSNRGSSLVAANGNSIPTFGTVVKDLNFRGLKTSHRFYLASVDRPILGADFFADNDLAIDLRGRRLL